jgi:adenylate kinase
VVAARSLPGFSLLGDPAKLKMLVLGQTTSVLFDRFRSLHIEHVSPVQLLKQEISRLTSVGRQAERAVQRGMPVPEETILAVFRRWFWMRKPDAGFILWDFPATLLQAKVFDEWLEARGSALSACLVAVPASVPAGLYEHYHTQGYDFFVVPDADPS